MLATLDCLIKIASDKFDIMEEDVPRKEFSTRSSSFGKVISGSFSSFSESTSSSPVTPKSVLPETMKYTAEAGDSPTLWSLRIQAVGKLNPIDIKRLSYHMSPQHIEKEPSEPTIDKEKDHIHKDRHPEKESTSEDPVFDLDTTEESDRKNNDNGRETHKPQAMEEVELSASPRPLQPQSPKPLETPTLLQNAPSPSPNSDTVPLPPSVTPPMQQPNVTMTPPPPLPEPPSAPKLQQSPVAVRMPPTLPPPPMSLKPGAAPPPPMPCGNGAAAPPPPPLGAGRSLRPKATTKLKRSTQLGNLYRTLKGKVEGSNLNGRSFGGRTNKIGAGSTGGKQGMADALAEMTKRYSFLVFKGAIGLTYIEFMKIAYNWMSDLNVVLCLFL